MSLDAPDIRSSRPTERALSAAKKAINVAGVDDWARRQISARARPLYRRTIAMVPNREELPFVLNARGLRGVGAEIGVARGDFSEHILSHWHGAKLISIDPWIELPPDEYVDVCNIPQSSMQESYERTVGRLARFGDRSAVWRATGSEAAKRLAPESLDFVYIDARHTYEAVLEDLADWFPLVRPGAIVAGHDYNDGHFAQGIHGVRSAVDEFFGQRRISVSHTYTDVPSISWLARKPR
jgi:hypothetical protein